MRELKKNVAKLYDLDGDWDEVIFTCHNPTNSDVYFNLFDPLIVQQNNVPNTPTGYVQPPVVLGTGSNLPSPPPIPVCNNFPDTNTTIPYVGRENFTFNYDTSSGRLFMTYFNGVNWRLTYQSNSPAVSFFTFNIAFPVLALGETIIDASISETSSKIIIITNKGRVFIVNTITFTIISTFFLTTSGANTSHNRVTWNATNNTWYITANTTLLLGSDRIIVVDAVTNTELTTIIVTALSNPFGISFVQLTNQMVVTYNASNKIAVINCTSNTISILISSPLGTSPQAIFYNSVSNLVIYGTLTTIYGFDFNTLIYLSSTIPQSNSQEIGYYPPANKIYIIPNQTNTTVYVANGDTLGIDATITLPNGSGERAKIAYYPPTNRMFMNYGFPISGNGQYYQFNQSCSPIFWIDGSAGYNFTVRDFFNNPAWVRRIYIYSKTQENFKQVINHIYKDANGIECQIPLIPSMSVGVNQFQGWIAQLDFPNHEAIFGINQWFQNVLIKNNSELTMLLIYKQIEKSKLLSMRENIGDFDACPNRLRKWSETDLKLYDTATISPYKQNMYLGQTQDAVRPFDFSILKKYENKLV